MKKKVILIIIIVPIILTILWIGGVIPKQIAKISGNIYVTNHFPKMQLDYVSIEWSKYHNDYIITFKDKDNNNHGFTIGPKYFPINPGQGIFEFEEIYKNTTETSKQEQDTEKIKEENIDMIKIRVNNNVLEVKLEDNKATKSLVEKLKNAEISVNASEYGGFEKVGNFGFSLPRNDKNITTSAGDIVLFQGNQISLFYNSNSWSYTKLGKVQNVSEAELKNTLGSGNVTLILSIE